MGEAADDLRENDDFETNDTQMCTNCGEIVREDNILFIEGKSCCTKCE